MFHALARLTWLHLLRHLRGWRWRAALMASIGGAYWFGRTSIMAPGSSSWFPGQAPGVSAFAAFFALVALILGIDAVGQWDRHRARRSLDSRLVQPLLFLAASAGAIVAALAIPALIVALWAPVGAWRADYVVLWLPNVVYFGAVLLPLLFCSGAAGLFARIVAGNDFLALLVGVLLLAPVLAFRLEAAPARELFLLASANIGILLPRGLLVREALLTAGCGLLFLGVAGLLVPLSRPRTPSAAAPRFFSIRLPRVALLLNRLRAIARKARGLGTVACLLLIGAGVTAMLPVLESMPRGGGSVRWGSLSAPAGTERGEIPPVRIVHRKATLPGNLPGEKINLTLDILGTLPGQAIAAFTFGDAYGVKSAVRDSGGQVQILPGLLGGAVPVVGMRFDPPLNPGVGETLRLELEPRRESRRLLARVWHPRFRYLEPLGPWYGEALSIDYNRGEWNALSQPTPWTIEAPEVSPLNWIAGSALVRPQSGTVLISEPLRSLPDQLLAAQVLRVDRPTTESLDVAFAVNPTRRDLARALHPIYEQTFLRIRRVMGQPPTTLLFYELPEQAPSDPMALPAPLLDRLDPLLPWYGDYDRSTRHVFQDEAPRLNRAIVGQYLDKTFTEFEHRELLRVALAEYLHRYALAEGKPLDRLGIRRQDVAIVPWLRVRGGQFPFDPGKNVEGWQGPIFKERRSPAALAPPPERHLAFHHALRGHLGDEAFRDGLHALFQEHRGEALTVDLYRRAMEQASGADLAGYFHQWLDQGVVPEYRITRAQAFLMENSATRALEYRTDLTVENRGDGEFDVMWVLVTEEDPLMGTVRLGAGQSQVLSLRTIDRPVLFELDPEGWIPQKKPPKGDGPATDRPRALFKVITEI